MNTDEKFFENSNGLYFKSGYPSQWYMADFTMWGYKYCCCEQMMMHQKALMFGDTAIAQQILQESDPKTIKTLGRAVKGFDVNVWNAVADDIVYFANLGKFMQHCELKEKLLSTGDKIIVECAEYDSIWGIGLNITDALRTPPEMWKGSNRLGKALMRVRNTLREF